MTQPRDGAPDEPLEPKDDEAETELDNEALEPIDDDAEVEDEDLEPAGEAEIDDYEAALREVAGESVPAAAVPATQRPTSAQRRAAGAPSTTRAPSPSEVAVHVKENVSRYYVIAAVAVFVIIFLNAILLGTGGVLRPLATPTPIPTESPSESPGASASENASPSETTTPSGSASPSTTTSPSAASPAASPSAATSPSPAPSAS